MSATPGIGSLQVSAGVLQTLREALRLFWSVADRFARQRLLLALALVAATAAIAALTPIALKLVVDALSQGIGGARSYMAPTALVILYVSGQYLTRCTTELRTMLHGHAEQRIRRQVGERLFEHLMRLPLRFHLDRGTGAMGETAEQGIRGYQLLLQHLVFTILPVAIELIVVALVLVQLGHDIYLGMLLLSAAAYVCAFRRGAMAVRDSAKAVSKSHIRSHAVMTDSLLNHETVKYFGAEPVVCSRYGVALGEAESAWRTFFNRRASNGLIVATIFGLSLGASLLIATHDAVRGAITVGDFVLVNAYVLRLVQPLELLGFAVRDAAQGVAFLGSMLALFREKPEGDGRPAMAVRQEATGGELTFSNVSFRYRKERAVLANVSFTVPAGKTVAVVGATGSGKSSLIRLLFRLYEPDSGRILLDGVPIADMSLSAVRRATAVVPQDTVLFNDTVAANIGVGRVGATRPEVEEAARIADLHDFIMSLPEEYETIVGERGLKLSGGERQRVAIARAALKRPRITVFDEATSSLDSRTEAEILRNLARLARQCTTLVIAHRLSMVVHADQILVLHRGEIVERGMHDELLTLNGHYASLWHAQQRAVDGHSANVA